MSRIPHAEVVMILAFHGLWSILKGWGVSSVIPDKLESNRQNVNVGSQKKGHATTPNLQTLKATSPEAMLRTKGLHPVS